MLELLRWKKVHLFVNKAIDSIKQSDIGEVKVLKKPSDIIRLIFDCVLLLFYQPLNPVVPLTLIIKKQEVSMQLIRC